MTDPNYTHMAFLLDASGSMASIKSDVEGGFDAFIADQRTQPGRCTVTLADFSGPATTSCATPARTSPRSNRCPSTHAE